MNFHQKLIRKHVYDNADDGGDECRTSLESIYITMVMMYAGKTTLYRLLLGLEPIANGQTASNATRYIAGEQLKLCTGSGLQATSQSPIIIDTPGMFDPDKTLADAARFRGKMDTHSCSG